MTNNTIIGSTIRRGLFLSILFTSFSFGQQLPDGLAESASGATQPEPLKKGRILGIIPNNRTWPSLKDYKPLSPREKFEIAPSGLV